MTYSLDDIKVGDTIKLEHGDGSKLVDREVSVQGTHLCIWPVGASCRKLAELTNAEGWSITAIERAVVLPTEPGYYADRKGDPWKLGDNGYWYDHGYVNSSSNRDMSYITASAPFTRLVPEAETARKVFERIADFARSTTPDLNIPVRKTIYLSELPAIAAEFGVTPS